MSIMKDPLIISITLSFVLTYVYFCVKTKSKNKGISSDSYMWMFGILTFVLYIILSYYDSLVSVEEAMENIIIGEPNF